MPELEFADAKGKALDGSSLKTVHMDHQAADIAQNAKLWRHARKKNLDPAYASEMAKHTKAYQDFKAQNRIDEKLMRQAGRKARVNEHFNKHRGTGLRKMPKSLFKTVSRPLEESEAGQGYRMVRTAGNAGKTVSKAGFRGTEIATQKVIYHVNIVKEVRALRSSGLNGEYFALRKTAKQTLAQKGLTGKAKRDFFMGNIRKTMMRGIDKTLDQAYKAAFKAGSEEAMTLVRSRMALSDAFKEKGLKGSGKEIRKALKQTAKKELGKTRAGQAVKKVVKKLTPKWVPNLKTIARKAFQKAMKAVRKLLSKVLAKLASILAPLAPYAIAGFVVLLIICMLVPMITAGMGYTRTYTSNGFPGESELSDNANQVYWNTDYNFSSKMKLLYRYRSEFLEEIENENSWADRIEYIYDNGNEDNWQELLCAYYVEVHDNEIAFSESDDEVAKVILKDLYDRTHSWYAEDAETIAVASGIDGSISYETVVRVHINIQRDDYVVYESTQGIYVNGGDDLDPNLTLATSCTTTPGEWISNYTDTKVALANLCVSKGLNYDQEKYVTVKVNDKNYSVRTDCSGYVSFAMSVYTGENLSFSSYSLVSETSIEGFTKFRWNGWSNLAVGDIVARKGHTEIFAGYDTDGTPLVYSCGSTSGLHSLTPQRRSASSSYTVVWRANNGGLLDSVAGADTTDGESREEGPPTTAPDGTAYTADGSTGSGYIATGTATGSTTTGTASSTSSTGSSSTGDASDESGRTLVYALKEVASGQVSQEVSDIIDKTELDDSNTTAVMRDSNVKNREYDEDGNEIGFEESFIEDAKDLSNISSIGGMSAKTAFSGSGFNYDKENGWHSLLVYAADDADLDSNGNAKGSKLVTKVSSLDYLRVVYAAHGLAMPSSVQNITYAYAEESKEDLKVGDIILYARCADQECGTIEKIQAAIDELELPHTDERNGVVEVVDALEYSNKYDAIMDNYNSMLVPLIYIGNGEAIGYTMDVLDESWGVGDSVTNKASITSVNLSDLTYLDDSTFYRVDGILKTSVWGSNSMFEGWTDENVEQFLEYNEAFDTAYGSNGSTSKRISYYITSDTGEIQTRNYFASWDDLYTPTEIMYGTNKFGVVESSYAIKDEVFNEVLEEFKEAAADLLQEDVDNEDDYDMWYGVLIAVAMVKSENFASAQSALLNNYYNEVAHDGDEYAYITTYSYQSTETTSSQVRYKKYGSIEKSMRDYAKKVKEKYTNAEGFDSAQTMISILEQKGLLSKDEANQVSWNYEKYNLSEVDLVEDVPVTFYYVQEERDALNTNSNVYQNTEVKTYQWINESRLTNDEAQALKDAGWGDLLSWHNGAYYTNMYLSSEEEWGARLHTKDCPYLKAWMDEMDITDDELEDYAVSGTESEVISATSMFPCRECYSSFWVEYEDYPNGYYAAKNNDGNYQNQ
jgi:hypothetical protein